MLKIGAAAQTTWKTFRHENRFTIQLPNYFKRGLLVAAGTLQYFDNTINKDISVCVETFGDGTSSELRGLYESGLKTYNSITYKVLKQNWYVISGQDEEGIFYNKSLIKNGIMHHLRINYPIQYKAQMNTVIPKVSSSFK